MHKRPKEEELEDKINELKELMKKKEDKLSNYKYQVQNAET